MLARVEEVDCSQLLEISNADRTLGPLTQLGGRGEQGCGEGHDDGDDDQHFHEGEALRSGSDWNRGVVTGFHGLEGQELTPADIL